MEPRLAAKGITKRFGDHAALLDVDLEIESGEIHALIGQNGSGKSTLTKVLTGYHAADAGTVAVDGVDLGSPVRWSRARTQGVMIVHQSFGLVDTLSVTDNVLLGEERPLLRPVPRRESAARVGELLRKVGLSLNPDVRAGDLSVGERSLVAVARALRDHQRGSGLLILDESTRSMSGGALERFHDLLDGIAEEGTSVLLISHNLAEVGRYAHRVTVLRDGRSVVSGLECGAVTEQALAELTLGRSTGPAKERQPTLGATAEDPFAVEVDLRGRPQLTFTVSAGEVLGITGVPESGFEEIPAAIAGASSTGDARVSEAGVPLFPSGSPVAARMRRGIGYVPERREVEGLDLAWSISSNIALANLERRARPWFMGRAWQRALAAEVMRQYGVRASGPDMTVGQLSGGNQQKVLVGKWLSTSPRLLILHEPTQAVDVGAREEILDAIATAAVRGVAILLVALHTCGGSRVSPPPMRSIRSR